MTEKIGVRELKNQASQIVRRVREEQAEYIVTVHGKPAAMLRPFTETDSDQLEQAEIEEALAQLEALAKEIGAEWQSEKSGLELLEEMREERWQSLTPAS